jgi:sugar phosphate isomerase/epimerase
MNRRDFVRSTAVAAAAGRLASLEAFRTDRVTMNSVGVQLFSLPRMLEKDFRASIAMLASIGYSQVQLYGPFPFSAAAAQASWKAVTPQLGFSGSGFFGMTAAQVRAIFDEHRIRIPAVHTDWETLKTGMNALADAAQTVGFTYVGLPSIPDALRRTLDDYKRMADEFNRVGESAKRAGLKFAYHNHGYGIAPMEGQIPLHLLLERTDPQFVFFEMDLFWTTAGGANPIELLRTNPGRYHLMHVKDMKELRRFRGDGDDAAQWIELFPFMTTAGDGVLDLRGIIAQAKTSGVQHFFVEQDLVADPATALKRSYDFVRHTNASSVSSVALTCRMYMALYCPPRAISSGCVPCSTTRPFSISRIRSASRMVDRRCAMTNVVRPARSVTSAA